MRGRFAHDGLARSTSIAMFCDILFIVVISKTTQDEMIILPRFVTYNTFPCFANHMWDLTEYLDGVRKLHDEHGSNLASLQVLFVKQDFVDVFAEHAIESIGEPVVLILAVGDATPSLGAIKRLLQSSKVKHIFATNLPCSWSHLRITHLPIGFPEIERATGNQTMLGLNFAECARDKRWECLVPGMRSTCAFRSMLQNMLKQHPPPNCIKVFHDVVEPAAYMTRLSQYAFCLAPRGNGLDVHRVYECLLVHTLPIYISDVIPGIVVMLGIPYIVLKHGMNVYNAVQERITSISLEDHASILKKARPCVLSSTWFKLFQEVCSSL